jgi:hypothetical protein
MVDAMEEVSDAELLAAGRLGRVLDCADGGARRPVGADLIRRCCLELKDQIDPRGLQFRHASVRGPVDLAGLDVPLSRPTGCAWAARASGSAGAAPGRGAPAGGVISWSVTGCRPASNRCNGRVVWPGLADYSQRNGAGHGAPGP